MPAIQRLLLERLIELSFCRTVSNQFSPVKDVAVDDAWRAMQGIRLALGGVMVSEFDGDRRGRRVWRKGSLHQGSQIQLGEHGAVT